MQRATAFELLFKPTSFAVMAGRGQAAAECEPWVTDNIVISNREQRPAIAQDALDRRRRRMVRNVLGPQLDDLTQSLAHEYGTDAISRITQAIDVARGRLEPRNNPGQQPALFHVPGLCTQAWIDPGSYRELDSFVEQLEDN